MRAYTQPSASGVIVQAATAVTYGEAGITARALVDNLVRMPYLVHMTQAKPQRQGAVPQWTQADRFRKARESMNPQPTQDEFAAMLEVDRNTVSNYESGRTTRPMKSTVTRWALISGVPREWLETGESPHPGIPDGGEEVGRHAAVRGSGRSSRLRNAARRSCCDSTGRDGFRLVA